MLLPLLWKDIRLNKYVILLTIFLVDTPYLTTVLGLTAFTGEPETDTPLKEKLLIAFPFSLIFLTIASAFIGGSPMSAEKTDRTDRFLDFLPPTRLAVVTSKVLTAVGLLFLGWVGPIIVYFTCVRPTEAGRDVRETGYYYGISASLILFGLAWLASLYIRSSTLCGLAALVGWLAVLMTTNRCWHAYHPGPLDYSRIVQTLLWVGIGIAVFCLVAGVGLFLRMPAD